MNQRVCVLALCLSGLMAFVRPAAADTVWTLGDAVLQYDNSYPFVATLDGTFSINPVTGALDSYQFQTATALHDFGGGSAPFQGAPYPGPEPGASINSTAGCIYVGFELCFFGPPEASAGPNSLNVGYADLEPQLGFLPEYVVHTLFLDFSGPLTTPGTIQLLGDSNEAGNNGFVRDAISGYATGVDPTAPEPGFLALVGMGLAGLVLARRRVTRPPKVRVPAEVNSSGRK